MAIETLRTLAELKEECDTRGICVVPSGKGGKYKKEDFVMALRGAYLVERYGEPECVPFPLRFMLTMDCPMLCKRYAQCKPEKQIALWRNDGKYAFEEKIDGCMTYDTPVLLSDGTTKPIGEIVENRLAVEVMSFDETTQTLVPRKVTNWFNHGMKSPEQWVRKILVHDAAYHAQARSCYFTGNHVFFKTTDEYSDNFSGTWETLDPSLNRSNKNETTNACLVRVYRQDETDQKQNKNYCIKDAGNGYSLVKVSCSGIHAFDETNVNEVVTKDGASAYDIEVEGCHNFIADGFIVHNSRSVVIYDAETHRFDFYSRHNSVTDFLPISYRDTILTFGDFFSDTSFVLDCEIIATNPNTTVRKTCTTQLNSTSALLSMNPAESRAIQKENPLKFIVFDCLYDGSDIRNRPWHERNAHAKRLADALKAHGFLCEFNQHVLTNKREFYEDIIARGGEGVVIKDVDAPYCATTSRTDAMIKLKRTIACDLAKDIDAWVSGFTDATKGKSNENYIGGLIFSCKVRLKNGETVIREIGRCSGIPQDLRVEMTDYDACGNPTLKEDYYGRVATISGQDISGVSLRLTHCVLKAWRPDKDPSGCEVLDEAELEKLIM